MIFFSYEITVWYLFYSYMLFGFILLVRIYYAEWELSNRFYDIMYGPYNMDGEACVGDGGKRSRSAMLSK